ncbi:MAG: hypothetical protein IJN05_11165 [Ruminococcus sp.]|nr:hypothetical protein [Ruminococcus sp.]
MKKVVLILIAVLSIFFFSFTVSATEEQSIASDLGIDTESINEGLTPEAEYFIQEHNLTVENTEAMTEISPVDVLIYIWELFKAKLTNPLKVFASLLSVMLVSLIVSNMEDSLPDKKVSGMFGVISVLISVGIISDSVSECIDVTSDTLVSGSEFMIGYVPVFAGITASSGSVTSAAAYNLLVILVSQLSSQLFANIIVPVLSLCMALGIVEAINPTFHFSGITEGVKKAVTFIIGFIMTIFIGLMSLQSIVGASADTLGAKAAKYMVSNWIPFVGGAIADTYTTVKHSLGLLRGGTGFLGIAVIFIMIVPTLLEVIAIRAVFSIADTIADVFGISQIRILLKNTGWIMSIIFSILICFSVMLIISTTILMLVGLNIS